VTTALLLLLLLLLLQRVRLLQCFREYSAVETPAVFQATASSTTSLQSITRALEKRSRVRELRAVFEATALSTTSLQSVTRALEERRELRAVFEATALSTADCTEIMIDQAKRLSEAFE
jgi:Kef-type K+ transport system membrane component KefB